jgi:hypothetical protein
MTGTTDYHRIFQKIWRMSKGTVQPFPGKSEFKNIVFYIFYVLLPYITYVTQSGRFSQCPAFLSRMAKERDKKYSVQSPQQYKK